MATDWACLAVLAWPKLWQSGLLFTSRRLSSARGGCTAFVSAPSSGYGVRACMGYCSQCEPADRRLVERAVRDRHHLDRRIEIAVGVERLHVVGRRDADEALHQLVVRLHARRV